MIVSVYSSSQGASKYSKPNVAQRLRLADHVDDDDAAIGVLEHHGVNGSVVLADDEARKSQGGPFGLLYTYDEEGGLSVTSPSSVPMRVGTMVIRLGAPL
jgi:hypothetical protein